MAAGLAVLVGALASSAVAASYMPSSSRVALIPSNAPNPAKGPNGIMPISSYVSGKPSESFGKFSFSNLGLNQITAANLAKFDTVALIQVATTSLTTAAKTALSQFVANGGKLIIHDADQTRGNDYSWVLPGTNTTNIGFSCNACGSNTGSSTILQNSSLISSNPADASYVNLAEEGHYTDAIGDSNLFVTDDPRWVAAVKGTNGAGDTGVQLAYASNNGLIVYNGFDTDMIKTQPTDPWRCAGFYPTHLCPAGYNPSVDWLAQMWYSELNQSWGTPSGSGGAGGSGGSGGSGRLPQGGTPASNVGTVVTPSQAGLPTSGTDTGTKGTGTKGTGKKPLACVARSRMVIHLRNLLRLNRKIVRGKIARVDIYVNGRHVARVNGRLHDVVLKRLPRHRYVTVKVIATTTRRFHLISSVRYRAC